MLLDHYTFQWQNTVVRMNHNKGCCTREYINIKFGQITQLGIAIGKKLGTRIIIGVEKYAESGVAT